MKTNRSGAIGAVVLAGMLAVSTAAFAQDRPGRAKGDHHESIEKAIERLDLTEQQRAQIKQLRDQFQTQNQASIERMKQLRQQMRQNMQNRDREAAKATRAELKAEMERMKPAREALQARIKAVLTPAQIAELEKMKSERKEKMSERKGKMKMKMKDCHPGFKGEGGEEMRDRRPGRGAQTAPDADID